MPIRGHDHHRQQGEHQELRRSLKAKVEATT
jgi:hypothetical protein